MSAPFAIHPPPAGRCLGECLRTSPHWSVVWFVGHISHALIASLTRRFFCRSGRRLCGSFRSRSWSGRWGRFRRSWCGSRSLSRRSWSWCRSNRSGNGLACFLGFLGDRFFRSWRGCRGRRSFSSRNRWLNEGGLLVAMADRNREPQGEQKKRGCKIHRATLKDVGGPGSKDLVGHVGTEGRAQSFLFRTLHQDQQDHQDTDDKEQKHHEIDADVEPRNCGESHGRGTMGG